MLNLLVKCLGEPTKKSQADEYNFKCPNCKHKSARTGTYVSLAINVANGMYRCWWCDFAGKPLAEEHPAIVISRLFKKLGYLELEKSAISLAGKLFVDKKTEIKKDLTIPVCYQNVYLRRKNDYYVPGYEYLLSRNINDEDILKYNIKYSVKDKRLLFPSYDKDLKLNYYVTRSIVPDSIMPYINPPVKKTEIIFNEYLIDWNKPLVVVEGVFDYITTRDNSVPLLGSSLEQSLLIKRLIEHNTPVILALDPDASSKQLKIMKYLLKKDIEVSYISWEKETRDIAEMGTEKYYDYKKKLKRHNLVLDIEKILGGK